MGVLSVLFLLCVVRIVRTVRDVIDLPAYSIANSLGLMDNVQSYLEVSARQGP